MIALCDCCHAVAVASPPPDLCPGQAAAVDGLLLIHNDLVECLKTYDAGLLMVPCKDTIKEVKEGIVVKTLKRETLMQAQTPQVFKSEDIKVAYQKAKDEGYVATDDSQLFERYIDKDIKAVLGDYSNLKITTQEDLK